MATFNYTDVLPRGTTFVFGSWVCVADGAGGFRRYITHTREEKAKAPASTVEKLIEQLGEMKIGSVHQLMPATSSTPARTQVEEPELDPNPSGNLSAHPTRPCFGLHNPATVYQEAMRNRFESTSGTNSDALVREEQGYASTCCEAKPNHHFNSDSDDEIPLSGHITGLVIISTSQGRFVYWRDQLPEELDDSRRVSVIITPVEEPELPFQYSQSLVDYSLTTTSTSFGPDREIFMANTEDVAPMTPATLEKLKGRYP